jgi:synaptic vesicle membrane protein VAT-1
MKQVVTTKRGDPTVLKLVEAPDPIPGVGEVAIEVEAAGVNFADLLGRMGLYPDAPKLPAVFGYEVAGRIHSVGPGVEGWVEGSEVLAMTRFGGYASRVVVPTGQLVLRTTELPAQEAAALPVNGLTAWFILEEMARVREGDRVLVHSAAGGVGLMALDLLRWRKAYAVGTASPEKHGFLRARGYDAVVSSREDFLEALRHGDGFDLILDPLGGPAWAQNLALLRPGGRLACYGWSRLAKGTRRGIWGAIREVSSAPWRSFSPVSLMHGNKGVLGVNLGRLWSTPGRLGDGLRRLVELHRDGILRPHVHAAVPFAEAHRAHEMLHERQTIGKVVLVP